MTFGGQTDERHTFAGPVMMPRLSRVAADIAAPCGIAVAWNAMLWVIVCVRLFVCARVYDVCCVCFVHVWRPHADET